MSRLVICVALIATVLAEPPSGGNSGSGSQVVDQALLSRVADIYSKGGDGSSGRDEQSNEGAQYVNSELLARIASIINQNEGSVGGKAVPRGILPPETGVSPAQTLSLPTTDPYGAAPTIDSYANAVPQKSAFSNLGSQIELGQPEAAQRIASFSIEDGSNNNFRASVSPDYYSGPVPLQGSVDTYAASAPGGSTGEQIVLEQPKEAQRIAAFDIEDSDPVTPSNSFRPPQARRSY